MKVFLMQPIDGALRAQCERQAIMVIRKADSKIVKVSIIEQDQRHVDEWLNTNLIDFSPMVYRIVFCSVSAYGEFMGVRSIDQTNLDKYMTDSFPSAGNA